MASQILGKHNSPRYSMWSSPYTVANVSQTITLSQIARFLHAHKDEATPADGISKSDMTKGKPDGP